MSSRQLAKNWPFPRHKEFRQKLEDAAAVWFSARNYPTHDKMPYCLSKWVDWGNNIILKEVQEYIQNYRDECRNDGKPFPLHKYIHHGLSSQAMAFNLIGPQITRKDYSALVQLLQSKGVNQVERIDHACFEYEDRQVFCEDTGQPTSVDIVLKDADGNPIIFIESKLVEQEFGGCSVFASGDCEGRNPIGRLEDCYLHFLGRQYWKLMTECGMIKALANEKQCIFMAHYQFFREALLSIKKNGTFVLLSDERSPVFHCTANGGQRGIMPFLLECIPPQYRDRIVSISIQEMVSYLKDNENHNDWVPAFESKYGMNAR